MNRPRRDKPSSGSTRSRRVPDSPGGPSAVPEFVQIVKIAAVIHGMPEAAMLIRHQFAGAAKTGEGLVFEDQRRVIHQAIEKRALEYEKAPANQAPSLQGFFHEVHHAGAQE